MPRGLRGSVGGLLSPLPAYHNVMNHYGDPNNPNFAKLIYSPDREEQIGFLIDHTVYDEARVLVVIDMKYRMDMLHNPSGQHIPIYNNTNIDMVLDVIAAAIRWFAVIGRLFNSIFLAIDHTGNTTFSQRLANRCHLPVCAPRGEINIAFQWGNAEGHTYCFLLKENALNQLRWVTPVI
ncbi:hypothetical protein Xmau_04312 [Xenorhabdus mauleonii]|uniref:Uncharacterized protein n=1 Tax=Xenorhabdus mauleonii TaxID=351675 RepID=A0A1I3YJN1_9GAMM|nr:hypothetical protein [Xenorhabdus mauleonii]PHM36303.1 hypothetical protein Xmau_04312 [Xenorhabdus mauleonii]SFK32052.1 hypothetical protein SAMN05421680_1582 [Xenorhabdus mauleonii]